MKNSPTIVFGVACLLLSAFHLLFAVWPFEDDSAGHWAKCFAALGVLFFACELIALVIVTAMRVGKRILGKDE